ncbi:prepilin peptidase [Candidatus Micrarchaeota archaeon]|nr:prepilin peptidase [Candidatus Micrarchaeota archaeon]MBI5177549.1 prepilin peptidase [Candidatus Micrarchaeota archaeon]
MQLNFEIIRVAAVLAGALLAAEQDRRTSFIDEKITYSMIGAGIILNVLSFDANLIAFALGGAAVIFALGYALYKYGKLGGADVLLFCGIHLLLPYPPAGVQDWFWQTFLPEKALAHALVSEASRAIPFVASVFVASAMIAIAGTAVLYFTKLWGRKLKPDLPVAAVIAAAAIVIAYLFNAAGIWDGPRFPLVFVLAVEFICAGFVTVFQKQIMDEVIAREVPIAKIEDEDVILTDRMDRRIAEKYRVGPVATEQELVNLKKIEKNEGIRKFPVAKELPRLGPYIFIALALAILIGDLVAFALVS